MSKELGPEDESVLTVDDPQDFVKVAASRGRVRNGQTNDFLGVDDEHGSDGEGNALGIYVAGILVVQHVVQGRDLTVLIGDLENTMNFLLKCSVGSQLTMGYLTCVGPATFAPKASMSLIQASCCSRPLAERPISFTPRAAKSFERRATSPSSVVQTGVKSSMNENR